MNRQGQFLTVPCRCSRTNQNQSPNNGYARNENADVEEYNFENTARSRKGCPEMNDKLWNALTSLREKTCRYKNRHVEGNEFDDASPRFQETRSPPYGCENVLRKANDLIDYAPESEFLKKMKQQCQFLQSYEPNIFSVLDEDPDDECFDFERPRTTENRYNPPMDETYVKYTQCPQPLPLPKEPPLSSYSKGNENYPPENFGCSCQQHQGQSAEDKKSEHVSRSKKRAEGGRRKRKSGSAGTQDSEDQFQPSLKKPYENSCHRCWRYASPARSPVNKPDQKFDPNFRRAHSCATLEKMGEDSDDLQVQDKNNSPCYRSKSIPGSGDKKSSLKAPGRSSSRSGSGNVRFSQPHSASPRAPDLQISTAKPVKDLPSAQPPSPPGPGSGPSPKGARDSSPRRYSPPPQTMQDPAQCYSPQKPRPGVSPPRAPPQEYPPAQTRPKSMQNCPQHYSPDNFRPDASPARSTSPPKPVQDAPQYSSPSRPREEPPRCLSSPRPSPELPRYSSPPRALQEPPRYSPLKSDPLNLSPVSITHEYLPPRCPVHPEVMFRPPSVQCPNQPPSGGQVPEYYPMPSVKPPPEINYVHRTSPRDHQICPKHGPKMAQLEPMQRPRPQSFIPGPSSTDVNRCYVSVDQQSAASHGMYEPMEKDQCFQLCSNMTPQDDLDVTEYKTYNPRPAAGRDQSYFDYSQSRGGMMSPVPEECSYPPGDDGEGSSGSEAQGPTTFEAVKGIGRRASSKGNSKGDSRDSKGSVDLSNAKTLNKSRTDSSPKNLSKSSSSPRSSSNRKNSPPGSPKKGKKKSPSSKNGSCKKACGKYTGKGNSPKASAENRICPPTPSSPKDTSKPCNSCSPGCGTKSASPKPCSAKRNSPTPSPSKQNKSTPPSSPKPGPSGVQRPQGRPQSANPATQTSSPSPRERPQTANQVDSSKSKMATKLPNEIYDAGHRVLDCTCFPRMQFNCSNPDAGIMCCHCRWQKRDSNPWNNPQNVLDPGAQSPKGFDGVKLPCPYRMLAYQKCDSDLFNLNEAKIDVGPMPPMPYQNRSSLEESSDLSHSRLLREVKECAEGQKPANSAARKYVVFYMTQSRNPKGGNVEVLVEELSKSCPDKTARNLTNKMRNILDNPTDSMALRFQKGIPESKTPSSSRVLYF